MNLIQQEQKKAKSMTFKLIPDTELVELSPRNVAIAEAMVQNDSAYRKSSDKSAKPEGKYHGSTAYWMTQLKSVLVDEIPMRKSAYMDLIQNVVIAVDNDNSTHLNADGVGRKEIARRIYSESKDFLLYYLKSGRPFNDELVFLIARKTTPATDKDGNFKHPPRTNLSFASKFCHYACFYLFEGEPEQDYYPIYDSVLKTVIPRYTEFYGLQQRNMDSYTDYWYAIDDIIKASGAQISRNGFDHLLWYYYKGRI